MQTTLFVVDDSTLNDDLAVISFDHYLRDYPKLGEPKTRVINLCDTDRYLSQGYYCSLLAEARKHLVLPSVKTINRLRDQGAYLWFDQLKLPAFEAEQSLVICMGQALDTVYQSLALRIFQELPTPILLANISQNDKGIKVNVSRVSLNQLNAEQAHQCVQILSKSSQTLWRKHSGHKRYRWDLAILVDDNETVPPSNKGALVRFIKAAGKLGIRAQLLRADELVQLSQFDGLFIRETTAINHHTYQLAHRAEQLGLVVMDDADSILRCCNKVFLHDAFNYQKVPSLKTVFVRDASESTLQQLEQSFGYPLVLKMPEGSFSRGVFKAKSHDELKTILDDLLEDSALVLAQEYLYTDHDWRIGVLNGRALYACRYFMARNHWQIYNHGSSRNFSGGFDAMATFEVPRKVLQAALKAASVVGTGLYGIDVKEHQGHAYVLEVNDNPNIDHGIEDHYLGEELYMQIMAEFLRRMELRGQK
jgi:glutathione synthase/RimK-type ligase-like ATP-grasp enzyme